MDAIDSQIVSILSRDSRTTVTAISQQVGRSRIAVQNRIDALLDRGEITGFSVNLKRKPFPALLEIQLHPKCKCEDVIPQIKSHFRINRAWSVAGGSDLFIWTEADEGDTLQRMRSFITALTEVQRVSTHIVIRTYE